MTGQPAGPRRAQSFQLRRTRALAVLAIAVLVAGVVSDVTEGSFWVHHALLSGLAGSVIVVLLSVAVINEVIERKRRHQWRVLAQYVMLQLVRNARMVWLGALEAVGLLPTEPRERASLEAGAEIVRDTRRLTAALRLVVDDEDRLARLQAEIALLAEHLDAVLSRWAAVMLNAEVYADVIDRHVELAGDVAWISDVLDGNYPPHDVRRQRRARSNPATYIWSELDGEWLADRLVVIVQLAESLDRGTLDLALQVVPVEWWSSRLATAAADPDPELG